MSNRNIRCGKGEEEMLPKERYLEDVGYWRSRGEGVGGG